MKKNGHNKDDPKSYANRRNQEGEKRRWRIWHRKKEEDVDDVEKREGCRRQRDGLNKSKKDEEDVKMI